MHARAVFIRFLCKCHHSGTSMKSDSHMYCVQYFREKIKAEVEGRPYTAPPPSKTTSGAAAGPGAANMTRNSRSFGKNNWDDWGDGPSGAGRPAKVCNQPFSHSACRPCSIV